LNSNNSFSFFYWLKHNFTVALGIIVVGYIGTLLSTPPSTASPIWPPAGLALAVMLVYGRAILPGIYIGALLLNTYSFLDFSTPESLAPSFISGLITCFGLCLQVSFGTYLINRFIGKENPLIDDPKIIYFFFLAAPVSSIVSASIGIATVFYQGFITVEEIPISWLTWWVGDCIGVIIFTPIILAFIAKPKALWKVRRKLVSYPLLIMFILIVAMFQYNQYKETERISSVFERQVNKFHALFSNEILHHIETNEVLKGFFDSSQSTTAKEFNTFTQAFFNKKHNIQALEWISYVPLKQRKEFENSTEINLIIREPNNSKEMVRAAEREAYFPITYVQPLDDNKRALGFDVGTNSKALAAILKAKKSGETTITEPIQLVQDIDKKTGFVLYSPVYHKNTLSDDTPQLKGFTAMVFRIVDEIDKITAEFPDVQLFIKIQDQKNKIYSNFKETKRTGLNLLSLQKTIQIQVANHNWSIVYQPSSDFYHNHISWTIWWLFLGGFIITSLTGIGLLMLSGRTIRTEELVRLRTQDLAKSEERWQFALEGNRQGVWDWNIQTSDVFFSIRWKQMLGYEAQDVDSKLTSWDKLIHPDDKEKTYEILNKHFERQTPFFENEHRLLCKDGTYKWTVGRGMVVSWTEDNKPLRMIGTQTDISEQKNAQAALELSEELFRTMFEEAPLGVALIDSITGQIYQVNSRFADIAGRTKQEMLVLDWMTITHPDDVQEDLDNMALLNAGEISGFNMIKRYRHPDGVYVWINMTIAPMTVSDKKCPRHLCMIEDISEQRKTEEALRRAQKMDAVGQLTGGIAHDFNNILNIILGNIDLLKLTVDMDDKGRKRLDTITKSAKRAANLTKQLLSFTRNKAVKVASTNINEVVLAMNNMIMRSITPQVEVEHILVDNLWLTEIDQGDFEDAVLNLVINARDAMAGSGQLIIETSNKSFDARDCLVMNLGIEPGDYVAFSISDNGEGILPEQQEHIFEPFFTTKPQGKGTGLGLAMVFGFCQRSKGNINVYSEPGKGTTFRIYLPKAKENHQDIVLKHEHAEKQLKGRETILVVDDEEDLVELVQVSLEALGYKVVTATNGKQGLEQLNNNPSIDLLFSDVVMPGGINGYQLAQQAKAKNASLKILLTSGFQEKVVTETNKTEFDNNLLSKPYSQTDILLRIRELLDNS